MATGGKKAPEEQPKEKKTSKKGDTAEKEPKAKIIVKKVVTTTTTVEKVQEPLEKPTDKICEAKLQDGRACTYKVHPKNKKFCKIHGTGDK